MTGSPHKVEGVKSSEGSFYQDGKSNEKKEHKKKDSRTALHRDERLRCINGKYVVQGEINVNDQKEDGWTALLLASQHGYTNMVNLLLEHSANPNIQCLKDQHSALLVAANNGHIDTVTALGLQLQASS